MNLLAQFKLLYNNVNSGKSPGLTTEEIYAFLTQAQDEFVRRYFSDKGNKYQEGFDDSAIRQADFSNLVCTEQANLTQFDQNTAHLHPNGYLVARDVPLESSTNTLHFLKHFQEVNFDGNDYLGVGPIYLGKGVRILTDSVESGDGEFNLWDEYNNDFLTQWGLYVDYTTTEESKYWIVFDQDQGQETSVRYTLTYTDGSSPNRNSFDTPIFITINEWVQATVQTKDGNKNIQFQVTPLSYMEFERLMRKPYKLPLKSEAWRLQNNQTHNIEIVIPVIPVDNEPLTYCVRYVRKPHDINSPESDDLEIDPILHYELVQRAVELAKASYNGDISAQVAAGQTSGTNLGYVTS